MPNRIIRESCCTSPTLDLLSDGAERMAWRLTTIADDHGRFDAHPSVLLANCFPLKVGKLTVRKITLWMAEMERAGLIQSYTVNNRAYAYFVNWSKYQRSYGMRSKYPDPVDCGNPPQLTGTSRKLPQIPALIRESRIENRESISENRETRSESDSEQNVFHAPVKKTRGSMDDRTTKGLEKAIDPEGQARDTLKRLGITLPGWRA